MSIHNEIVAIATKKKKENKRNNKISINRKLIESDIEWYSQNILPGLITWVNTLDPILFTRFATIGSLISGIEYSCNPTIITDTEIYTWLPGSIVTDNQQEPLDIRNNMFYLTGTSRVDILTNIIRHIDTIKTAILDHKDNLEDNDTENVLDFSVHDNSKVYIYLVPSSSEIWQTAINKIKELYMLCWGCTKSEQVSILPKGFPKFIFVPMTPMPPPSSMRRSAIFVNFDKYASKSEYVKYLRKIELQTKTNQNKLSKLAFPPTLLEATAASCGTTKDVSQLITTSLLESTSGLTKIDNPPNEELIGGFSGVKGWAKNTKEFMDSTLYEKSDRPRNILLVGLPGTGKTEMAKTLSSIFQYPLIELNISEMLASMQGESESNLRLALDTVSSIGKCIVLLDEVEKAIGGVESSSSTDGGVLMRMVNMLLRFTESNDNDAIVVMTANDPTLIPAPLMRSGRLDMIFYAGITEKEITKDIIIIYLKRFGLGTAISNKTFMDKLLEITTGYVGADIKAICTKVFQRLAINKQIDRDSNGNYIVNITDNELYVEFQKQRKHILPVTESKPQELDMISSWAKQCGATNVNVEF